MTVTVECHHEPQIRGQDQSQDRRYYAEIYGDTDQEYIVTLRVFERMPDGTESTMMEIDICRPELKAAVAICAIAKEERSE